MKKRLAMFLACMLTSVSMALAQTKVTGTVVSESDGQPVIGATVKVVGSSLGAPTDANGKFTVTLPKGKSHLQVSYIGMVTKTVTAKNGMRIVLASDETSLDEVMVVGYGTTKRSAFTGSGTEIKTEDITKHVSSTATSSLIGKVAGVTATSSNGSPGSSPTIRIRGIGSLSASSNPLYIVDGAPMDGNMSDINPNDIESISVLKDASATAIYGARGANGVVIITTKKGNRGDAKISFDAKWGSNSRLVPNYDVIDNPGEYYETVYKALYNSQYYHGASKGESYAYADKNLFDSNNGGVGYQVYTVNPGEKLIGTNFKLNPNATLGYTDGEYYYTPDDWYDEAFHNSFRQEYNATVSGATDKLNYYAGVGYLNDGGIVDNSNFQRYTGRANMEYQAKKWLKVTTNLNFTHTDSETQYDYAANGSYGSSGNIFYIANSMAPIYPLYVRNADGSIKTENGRVIYDRNQTNQKRPAIVGNAIGDNEVNSRQRYSDYFTGKWQADITPIDGLKLTASLVAQSYNSRYNNLYSPFGSYSAYDGQVEADHTRTFSVNQQYLASYAKTFANVHNFSILAGYEQYKYKEQEIYGYNTNMYSPYVGELENALGKANMKTSSYTDNYMTEGFLGRLSYDYAERYFISASIRRDASSRFAPGHRWGTFGSVGLAWQINKEQFMKDVKWVNLLKLKVSYGTQGNDDLYPNSSVSAKRFHPYADLYTTTYNEDTGEYNITMYAKGNEDLTWEKSKAWNVGVDFSLFGNRLNGTLEWYRRATSDMLYTRDVPLSSGLTVSSYPVNIGSMYNRGVELSVDGTVIKTKNFEWGLNFNITHNKNKITELDSTTPEEGLIYTNRILKVGGTIYNAYLYKFAGVDHETGEGMYYMDKTVNVTDANGNVVTDADGNAVTKTETVTTKDPSLATQYDCGTTLPDAVGGFGTSITAFGFDLSAQFSFQLGGKIYDGSYQRTMSPSAATGSNLHKDLLKSWSEDNKNSDIPRMSSVSNDDYFMVGSQSGLDYFLTSSDYLCLSNLTIGYTLPKNLVSKLDLSNVRVYFAGDNLFLLTKRQGLDPRYNYGIGSMTQYSGLVSDSYSAGRSITAGITVTF